MMDSGGTGTLRVRPYAITGGRTRATTDVPIETQVVRSARGNDVRNQLTMERGRILRLLDQPLSVAEISAHLHLPLGVARVLVGDMSEEDLVTISRPQRADGRPNLKLLERVFDGLQAL